MIEWRLWSQTTDKSDEYAVSFHGSAVSPRIFGSEPIYTTLCILYSVHSSLRHSSSSSLYYAHYRIKSFQHLDLNPIFRCWTHLRGSFNYLSAFLLIRETSWVIITNYLQCLMTTIHSFVHRTDPRSKSHINCLPYTNTRNKRKKQTGHRVHIRHYLLVTHPSF